jgi:hypothetical protein
MFAIPNMVLIHVVIDQKASTAAAGHIGPNGVGCFTGLEYIKFFTLPNHTFNFIRSQVKLTSQGTTENRKDKFYEFGLYPCNVRASALEAFVRY